MKIDIEKFIKMIKEREQDLGKERDKLDDLIDELAGLKEEADTALEYLNDARDALSRLV